jgi:hypothetical protein
MKLVRKLLGFGLLAASVLIVRSRRRALRPVPQHARGADARFGDARLGADARFDDNVGTSVPTNENLVEVATKSGIADVDPEPLSHVAGEGIDPTRDVAAHEEIAQLRDRLPRD